MTKDRIESHPIITIDPKAKSCPGVSRGILMTEDALTRGKSLYTVGQLIHNGREVARLQEMGLQVVKPDFLKSFDDKRSLKTCGFVIRCHGESEDIINLAKDNDMQIYLLGVSDLTYLAIFPLVPHLKYRVFFDYER